MVSFDSFIKTTEGGSIAIEDVPAATEFGRLYQATLKARGEHAEVNAPLIKLKTEQRSLEENIQSASLDNTTPEEFVHNQAKLELVNRKISQLQPKEAYLGKSVEKADENLSRLQAEHSKDVHTYQNGRDTMFESDLESLRRQIVARYSMAAAA